MNFNNSPKLEIWSVRGFDITTYAAEMSCKKKLTNK